ncbi:hypothetical protein AVEN_241668-1 [Araneus ventricosus]|uniref:Uncharacterized protein n=1 Tax=Araneus ventricosus TaxID=182803 RepID=A0A4Y2MJ65_ARAVE|nr:hypothetical protein AVEN_241668-1 [Araneus ventricosus]
MASVQENGPDQPNNIMEMFIDLKSEFSSFGIDINNLNTFLNRSRLKVLPDSPSFKNLTCSEELVKANLKPEDKTYVSAVRNSSCDVKRVKPDSKLVINDASKISLLKSVGKLPRRKEIFQSSLSPDTTTYFKTLSSFVP